MTELKLYFLGGVVARISREGFVSVSKGQKHYTAVSSTLQQLVPIQPQEIDRNPPHLAAIAGNGQLIHKGNMQVRRIGGAHEKG